MSHLKVLKLVNGDEIIGFVDDGRGRPRLDDEDGLTTDNLIFIKGPMKIVQEYDRTIGHQLFLMDWMPSGCSNTLPIPKDKIITMDDPGSSLEEHYLELMGTNADDNLVKISPEEKKKRANIELLKKTKFTDGDMN